MSQDMTEGDPCPQCGESTVKEIENCSCHISPPCSACVDALLFCRKCGWEDEPIKYEPSTVSVEPYKHVQSTRDLGNGKRILNYQMDSNSGSTMVYTGYYEGDVTWADIIGCFGDGTFGHRLGVLHNGYFKYTKITD